MLNCWRNIKGGNTCSTVCQRNTTFFIGANILFFSMILGKKVKNFHKNFKIGFRCWIYFAPLLLTFDIPPPQKMYMYIHTLTGHFIRCTLLVPGWTPFVFRTASILRGIDSTRCWKHYSEILVHIVMIASHSCCRFVGCTSMMWISRSTTSQRCSIGLRSGDCGGHLSKVNSLSCSRNQSETIWALWHGALSCWKYVRRWVHCSHKGMDMVSNNTHIGCGV